jgi:hypothetical protein
VHQRWVDLTVGEAIEHTDWQLVSVIVPGDGEDYDTAPHLGMPEVKAYCRRCGREFYVFNDSKLLDFYLEGLDRDTPWESS